MVIKQIVAFEFRGPGSPSRTCTPTSNYFWTQNKNRKGISLSGLLFTAKILQEVVHLTSLYLGQIIYKI